MSAVSGMKGKLADQRQAQRERYERYFALRDSGMRAVDAARELDLGDSMAATLDRAYRRDRRPKPPPRYDTWLTS